MHVFKPGSVVCHRETGKIGTDVEIVQPTWMNGQLMYQVKVESEQRKGTVKCWVSAKSLEESADASAWDYGWWNPETEEFADLNDAENGDGQFG